MSGPTTGVLARLRQPVGAGSGAKAAQRVGGTPRVSLLPGEVREAGAIAARRNRLIAAVALAALVACGGVALANQADQIANDRLASAQSQSRMLGLQIAKFDDVRALQQQIAVGKAAVRVGSSTMIDWQAQISAIEAGMPTTYTVTDISANGATPLAVYAQGDNNLEPTRVATIIMKLRTPTVGPEFSAWLLDLRDIPAYADASANTSYDSSTSTYEVALTVHLNTKALAAGQWTDLR